MRIENRCRSGGHRSIRVGKQIFLVAIKVFPGPFVSVLAGCQKNTNGN